MKIFVASPLLLVTAILTTVSSDQAHGDPGDRPPSLVHFYGVRWRYIFADTVHAYFTVPLAALQVAAEDHRLCTVSADAQESTASVGDLFTGHCMYEVRASGFHTHDKGLTEEEVTRGRLPKDLLNVDPSSERLLSAEIPTGRLARSSFGRIPPARILYLDSRGRVMGVSRSFEVNIYPG